jgi:hypothetical protein
MNEDSKTLEMPRHFNMINNDEEEQRHRGRTETNLEAEATVAQRQGHPGRLSQPRASKGLHGAVLIIVFMSKCGRFSGK